MSIGYLGTSDFGLLLTLIALFPWLGLLTGGSRITTRNMLSTVHEAEVFSLWRRVLSRSLLLVALLGAVFIIVGLVAFWLIETLFSGEAVQSLQWALLVLATYAAFTPVVGALAGGADALGRHNLYAGLSTGVALLSIPATWLGVCWHLPLAWFLMLASATFWLPSFLIWIRFFPSLWRAHRTESRAPGVLEVCMASSQGLGILFSSGLDVVIVASVLGLSVAGSYGVSTRLFGTLMIPAAALAPSQFRYFAQMRAESQSLFNVKRALRRVVARNTALTIFGATMVFAMYEYIFKLMTHGAYTTSNTLGFSLAVATTLAAIFATFFAASAGSKGLRVGRNFSLTVGLLNLILTYVLTKLFGILGPSLSSTLCFGLGILLWVTKIKKSPQFLVQS
jgi:O-antigen/teichoic acid export membrane protein